MLILSNCKSEEGRELDRQLQSSYYQRYILSEGKQLPTLMKTIDEYSMNQNMSQTLISEYKLKLFDKQILENKLKEITKEFGKGFSRTSLQNMRLLYLDYPICQSVTGKLSWTHYCELLSISDKNKRAFYEKETLNSNWSVRELKRQVNTSLYERLLLSDGKENKEEVYKLYQKRSKRKETRVEREEANLTTDVKINWDERIYVPIASNLDK